MKKAESLPPPATDSLEEPLVCLPLNRSWVAYLIAILTPARYSEYWGGTIQESQAARAGVVQLINEWSKLEDCMTSNPCGCDEVITHRLNLDSGMLEISKDGGVTWTQDPSDPHLQIILPPPPLAGGLPGHSKCDVAAGLQISIHEGYAEMLARDFTGLTIGEIILELAAFIVTFFFLPPASAALLTTLLVTIARAILTISAAALSAQYDSNVDEIVRCAAFCHLSENGFFTVEGYGGFLAELREKLPAPYDITNINVNLVHFIQTLGYIGCNALAAQSWGIGYDCSDCDCSACSLDDWQVIIGTEVERTSTSVTVDAVLTAGMYHVNVYPTDPFDCCCWEYTTVSGSIAVIASGACGTDNGSDSNLDFSYFGELSNRAAFVDAAPFTVMISSRPCA